MKIGNDNGRHKLSAPAPTAIVVMGVTGCGKTAVGAALAEALGFSFIEGDRLHPPENVEQMRRGEPLTDQLREGWLDAVGAAILSSVEQGQGAVAACSALKRIYRDRLRRIYPATVFVHLKISPGEARRRVARRRGHFMPASLVDSQFAALEIPSGDEWAISVDAEQPKTRVVELAKNFVSSLSVSGAQ